MKQIITGPFGLLAYHNAGGSMMGQYPKLNLPCCAFARGAQTGVANALHGPNVINLNSATKNRSA